MPIVETALLAAGLFGLVALLAGIGPRLLRHAQGAEGLLTLAVAGGLGLLALAVLQLGPAGLIFHPVTLAVALIGSLALLLRRARGRRSLY